MYYMYIRKLTCKANFSLSIIARDLYAVPPHPGAKKADTKKMVPILVPSPDNFTRRVLVQAIVSPLVIAECHLLHWGVV